MFSDFIQVIKTGDTEAMSSTQPITAGFRRQHRFSQHARGLCESEAPPCLYTTCRNARRHVGARLCESDCGSDRNCGTGTIGRTFHSWTDAHPNAAVNAESVECVERKPFHMHKQTDVHPYGFVDGFSGCRSMWSFCCTPRMGTTCGWPRPPRIGRVRSGNAGAAVRQSWTASDTSCMRMDVW